MKKYFTKLALVIGCVGSMCFLGGNTLASTKEIVSDMATFNRAREAVVEKYKDTLDCIRVRNEEAYKIVKNMLTKEDLVETAKDSRDIAIGLEHLLKDLNKEAERADVQKKQEVWEEFWTGIAQNSFRKVAERLRLNLPL